MPDNKIKLGLYEHRHGGRYITLHNDVDDGTQKRVVVIQSVKSGAVYVRSTENFRHNYRLISEW